MKAAKRARVRGTVAPVGRGPNGRFVALGARDKGGSAERFPPRACSCAAYRWPHRPGGGLCRWPGAPAAEHRPARPFYPRPRVRLRGKVRDKVLGAGLHPIRDRIAIQRIMPYLRRPQFRDVGEALSLAGIPWHRDRWGRITVSVAKESMVNSMVGWPQVGSGGANRDAPQFHARRSSRASAMEGGAE